MHTINASMREEILGLYKIAAGPHQTGTERTGTRFLTPLHIPVMSAPIRHIHLWTRSRHVFIDELEWRLRLALTSANSVSEVERLHVPWIGPQHVLVGC